MRRFAVISAVCDLVPGRRQYVALLPVQPIRLPASAGDQARIRILIGDMTTGEAKQPALDAGGGRRKNGAPPTTCGPATP
jgi:hypothetical protein